MFSFYTDTAYQQSTLLFSD